MQDNANHLNTLRILVIVVLALGMFGASMAYGRFVHFPVLEGLCARNCEPEGGSSAVSPDGYSRTSTMKCTCLRPGAQPETTQGYFLIPIGFLDWFVMIWVNLIPLGLLLFVSVLIIAKVVVRLPE